MIPRAMTITTTAAAAEMATTRYHGLLLLGTVSVEE